jgi:hypothetical protein
VKKKILESVGDCRRQIFLRNAESHRMFVFNSKAKGEKKVVMEKTVGVVLLAHKRGRRLKKQKVPETKSKKKSLYNENLNLISI